MNAPATTATTELQDLNRSLDLLLTAIVDLDDQPDRQRSLPPHPGAMTIADMAREYRWDVPTTPAERFMLSIKYDPVGQSLRQAVRRCGERLHEIGGLRAMQDACDRQEDLPGGMHRVNVLDKWFDGIGAWAA